jgi:DNA (cytosine-5)-methyltransferase 1
MKAIDLFCCSGGSSVGLKQAGFDSVTGVSWVEEPEYPFKLIVEDALKLTSEFLQKFDFIWASPPCQAYSAGGNKESRKKYNDIVAPTRELLLKTGKPFVIENVIQAPLRKDLLLCGEMFNLKVIRHRIFEIHGFYVPQIEHIKHRGTVSSGVYQGVYTGGRCGCFGNNKIRNKLKVGTIEDWQKAMGIKHITTRKGLAEAVPPAYAKYIGECFLKKINTKEIQLNLF